MGIDLKAARELCDKALNGPDGPRGALLAIHTNFRWHGPKPLFENCVWHILPERDPERMPICTLDRGDDNHEPTRKHAEAEAQFFAAAYTLLPQALDEIERLREKLAVMEMRVRSAESGWRMARELRSI